MLIKNELRAARIIMICHHLLITFCTVQMDATFSILTKHAYPRSMKQTDRHTHTMVALNTF